MKQIFLIEGLCTGLSSIRIVRNILEIVRDDNNFCVELIVNVDAQFDGKKVAYTSSEVLEKALQTLRDYSYNKETVVFYEGINTDLLKANLPCYNLDIGLLKNNLKEVVGGYDAPQRTELIEKMFVGAISQLIKN